MLKKLSGKFEPELVEEILQCELVDLPSGSYSLNKLNGAVEKIPIVLQGNLRVFQRDRFGNEVLLYNINSAQSCIVSINSTFSDNIRGNIESVATEDTKLAFIPGEVSKMWFGKYESWRNFYISLYGTRLSELVSQNNIVSEQNVNLEKQNKNITDSINYAKRIQEAALPTQNQIAEIGWEHFIFFKPRDIVSGDFYWLTKENDKLIIAAADATGHGVPGAFMSMLGIAFLSELREEMKEKNLNSNQILENLRDKIRDSLKQTGKQDESRDGIDIAMCIFDIKTLEMQFSGAYNPVIIIKCSGKLIELKADKQPIGGVHLNENPFTNQNIQLEKGDTVYLFSDGFKDQFGGTRDKKFSSKKFKELLHSTATLPMSEQKQKLDTVLTNWKRELDQVDDILVMGIKVK